MIHDIAEHKAEPLLRRLTALVDRSADLVAVSDACERPEYLNAEGRRMLGMTGEEGLPLSIFDMLHPSGREHTAGQILESVLGARVWQGEVAMLQARTGEPVHVDLRAFGILDAQGSLEAVAFVGRNISERRRIEEQLLLSQKLDVVGRLAGGVAHDFNNAMTVILGYTAMLLRKHEIDAMQHDVLTEIRLAAEHAASLARQLLALSRRQTVRPAALNLTEAVSRSMPILERLAGKSIRIDTHLDPDPWMIRADSLQIEQILMNLAANARDAMPEGGAITIQTSRAERLDWPGGVEGQWMRLSFADTGHGMDEATQRRLFEPFFTTKEADRGAGLALATVYAIVEQGGGHIRVNSEPGLGATFTLYFPRYDGAPA